MNKKGISLVCTGALLLGLAPQVGQAADSVSIDGVNVGGTQATLHYQGAKAGDWYHIFMGDQYVRGSLSADDVAKGALTLSLPRAAASGDTVHVQMAGTGNHFVAAKTKAKAGDAQPKGDLTVAYPAEVKPGATVKPRITVNKADVSGDVIYSYSGPIVAGSFVNGGFTVASDAPEGSTINVSLIYGDRTVNKSLVVRKNPSQNTPGTSQTEDFSLAQTHVEKGQELLTDISLKKTDQRAKALAVAVIRKENTGARVTASVVDPAGFLASGKGKLKFKADQNGTVDLELRAFDTAGQVLERYPFQIMVGPSSMAANQVRMTIGLKSLVIGNDQKEMDTAPFIQDNRTFVPLRALAEAFGAKVEYDNANQGIHIQMDGKDLLMTIGKKTFTINGVQKQMDVAPYLTAGGRTIVPVRFAAEGLGFSVDTTADAQGLTTDVIFTKAE